MSIEPGADLDPMLHTALEQLAAGISQRYAEAAFRVSRGEEDPAIVQLVATVDMDNTDPMLDVVMGRLLDLQAERLPVLRGHGTSTRADDRLTRGGSGTARGRRP